MSQSDCPSQETLSAFALGDLPEAELGAVAEHLDACTECEERAGGLDQVLDVVLDGLKCIRGTGQGTRPTATATGPDGSGELRAILGSAEDLGDFRIVREIGRGGMGVVCEAFQGSMNRHVALKFLPERGDLARFRREAKAAGRLHHTNIVPVFGVGEHRGQSYYVMQFIAGRGLDVVLKQRGSPAVGDTARPGRFGEREAARIGAQVADALASMPMATG